MATMCFDSFPAMCIYAAELMGQISDGKYENRRPFYHWKWVHNTSIEYDPNGKVGYDGIPHIINYNLNEWPRYIAQGGEWAWAERVLTYGRVGKVFANLSNQPVNYDDAWELQEFTRMFEDFPSTKATTIEELKTNCGKDAWLINNQWCYEMLIESIEKHVQKGLLTDEFVKEFYNTEFDMKELKAALKDMKYTVNHNL